MKNSPAFLVSIPFTAGTAIGAALASHIAAYLLFEQLALFVFLICLFFLLKGKPSDMLLVALMFLSLGVFCFLLRDNDLYMQTRSDAVGKLITPLKSAVLSAGFKGEHTSSLLQALMTGDRSGLGRDTTEAFRKSGASHLLALSGLHLGIIASFLRAGLSVLGRSRTAEILRCVILIAVSGLYCLACGASASLVRAFLFILFGSIASLFKERRSDPVERLCWAATLQLGASPTVVRTPAFILSYLAMIGVLIVAPWMESWYPSSRISRRYDPMLKIWKSVSLAVACQITTAPAVWLMFGTFPRYFMLTNLTAMPLCEILLPLALLTLILGSPPFLISLTDKVATLMIDCLEIIAEL